MLKTISILEIEKHGKKFPLYLDAPTTYGELFDVAMELRQFALNGIQEMIKAENEAAKQPEKPAEAEQPKVE